jgi:hypothetical protein
MSILSSISAIMVHRKLHTKAAPKRFYRRDVISEALLFQQRRTDHSGLSRGNLHKL